MKVLLINNYLYHRGGAETVFLSTGSLLQSKGHDVVYYSQDWAENYQCDNEVYFPKGIDTRSKNFLDRIRGIRNYFYNEDAARKIEELIIIEKPQIAHIHNFWGGLSGSILKVLKKYKIPVIHTVHDFRMVCPAYLFRNNKNEICEKCEGKNFIHCISNRCSRGSWIMSSLMCAEMYFRNYFTNPLDYIDGFMFVSNFCYDKCKSYVPRFNDKHCEVLYNFQDTNLLTHVNRELETYNGYYLYYGRLSHEKGINTLIKAFCFFSHLKLKIVGTGPLETDLRKQCSENGITNIEFYGYRTGTDLFDIIKNAKFVCVPSECYENNPMTIIESYTLRTPVIGAAIGGIPEIVKDGKTGFTFQPGNVESLKNIIEKTELLDEYDYKEMKNRVDCFSKKHFGVEQYYTKLMEFYNRTIN